MRRAFILLGLSLLVVSGIGCGSSTSSSSPAAPSVAGVSATGGAVITGSLTSGQAAASTLGVKMSGPAAGMGLTVTISGTSMTTTVDGSGQFTFHNVPGGDISLQFTGSGVSGHVDITSVESGETITLNLSLSGASVSLDADHRHSGNGDQLEGRVESLPPTTPAGTFIVAGQQVTTDANTQFFNGGTAGTFADLAIGQRVHVSGHMAGSALLAGIVQIQNTNTTIPVQVNGIVDSLTGTAASFQFNVSGQLIKGDSTTTFDSSSFSDLKNGVRVEVTGQLRDGFVFATRIHVNVDNSGGNQDQSASVDGTLISKSGSGSNLALVVGSTNVLTDASTVVRRRGDVQDLSVLQVGMTLHVEGTRTGTGAILARMIQIQDDPAGGQFEIDGSMGGLHGTCPSVQFVVNGFSIFTDGSTAFTPGCSTFKSGTQVKVTGTRQTDGTVKAATVAKQ